MDTILGIARGAVRLRQTKIRWERELLPAAKNRKGEICSACSGDEIGEEMVTGALRALLKENTKR